VIHAVDAEDDHFFAVGPAAATGDPERGEQCAGT
jgi:hypothetical protein